MPRNKVRRTAVWLASISIALGTLVLSVPAQAADAEAVVVKPAPRAARAVDSTAPLRNKSAEYGCKRIWRCDDQICEWRRGCYGIYGYMEGPYYSVPLARSHWQMHGWPTSSGN